MLNDCLTDFRIFGGKSGLSFDLQQEVMQVFAILSHIIGGISKLCYFIRH